MAERSSIVTRDKADQATMIRFVVAPDDLVVADIKGNLPGRGAWVELSRQRLEEAIKRKAFARSFKRAVIVPDDLAEQVDHLLVKATLGALALARRGGGVVTGAAQVEAAVRRGKAALVLHAKGAAADGKRKIAQAVFAAASQGLGEVVVEVLFDEQQMSVAFGADHVIHAALLHGVAANGFIDRLRKLKLYRGLESGV